MGSGVLVRDNGLLIATPTHNMEHLYSKRDGRNLFVSNSLVFLFEATGTNPDTAYPDYFFDLLDAQRTGIRPQPHRIHGDIELHTVVNLVVDAKGQLRYESKRREPPLTDYSSVERRLRETMGSVFENAADAARRAPMRPVATLSRGYDSAFIAALAATLGAEEGVTSVDSRFPHDLGAPVGEALGLVVNEYPRALSLDTDIEGVAEFTACPAASELPRANMADDLAGALLLVGNQGDQLFEMRTGILADYGHPTAKSGAGYSMGEFRKRIGMGLFPVPSIVALEPEQLETITNSEEMRPWSIGGDYDRPIARRLAEEAGLPRELFGQQKAATSHLWLNRFRWPEEAKASFETFMESVDFQPGRGGAPGFVLRNIQRIWWQWLHGGFRSLPIGLRQGLRPLALKSWWRRPSTLYGTVFLFTFHWGVEQIRHRYRIES